MQSASVDFSFFRPDLAGGRNKGIRYYSPSSSFPTTQLSDITSWRCRPWPQNDSICASQHGASLKQKKEKSTEAIQSKQHKTSNHENTPIQYNDFYGCKNSVYP